MDGAVYRQSIVIRCVVEALVDPSKPKQAQAPIALL
jgi:hypothetical protein